MEYFLELCDKNEDEFDIPHTKLIEYGVMTSTRSSNVKEKLDSLGLEIEVNYRLLDVQQPVKQGGFSTKKVYKLNNKSFKICLMRAQRRPNQPVDSIFDMMLSFMRATIPTWVGGSVMQKNLFFMLVEL